MPTAFEGFGRSIHYGFVQSFKTMCLTRIAKSPKSNY